MLIFHPISNTLRATTVVAFLFLTSFPLSFILFLSLSLLASLVFAFYLCYYAELCLFIVCGAAIIIKKHCFHFRKLTKELKKKKKITHTDPK